MPSPNEGFEQASRRFWEQRCGRPLTDEELREIRQNLVEYAKVLLEWDDKARAAKCQPSKDSVVSEDSTNPAGDEGTDTP